MSHTKINVGNVWMDNVTMQETLNAIEGFVARGTPSYITNPNVDIVIRYNRDAEFAKYYKEGALCVADGMPILWAAKFLGTPLKEKVSGSDLVPRVCELANKKGYKLFFLGGRPGAAEAAQKKLLETLGDLKVVGTYAPPFGFEKDETELKKIASMIKQARPDILFVGLGAPKQERWIKQYHQELGVPVCMGVGVTFEFIAGIVKRAPKWMQKAGFEWLWRLCMEPGRLWKRYLIDDTQFFGLILKQKTRLSVMVLMGMLLLLPVSHSADKHWEFAGWYGGGCFPNLTFDPKNQGRVYLTSDVAGIWRSDDLGENWHFATKGLGQMIVAQLAISPSDSNRLYAATKTGVYLSNDAGASWQSTDTVNGQIAFARPDNYRPIAIDSQNPDKLCVGTVKGQVFCSEDAGAHWKELKLEGIEAKAVAAITFETSDQLIVGLLSGLNRCWLSKAICESISGGPSKITDLLISKKSPQNLFVAGDNKMWMSKDAGANWHQSQAIPTGNIYRIALDESTDELIIRVIWNKGWKGGVLLSTDQGKSWKAQDNLHTDVLSNPTTSWSRPGGKSNSLHLNPFNPQVMFRTDWWGVFRSDDGGNTWHEKIKGAANTVGSQILISPKGDIYVATMDDGLLRSQDGGKTYECLFPKKYSDKTAGHVWRVALAGENIIATSSPWEKLINQVVVSADGGKTFDLIQNGLPEARPKLNTMWGQGYPRALAVDPKNPDIIYLGIDGDDGGGLFISKDRGLTWQRSESQPGSIRIYHALAVDPTNSNRIYWGATNTNGGLYVSEDAGKTFQYVFKQSQWPFDLAIASDGTVYVATDSSGAKLYSSSKQGKSWKMIGDFGKGRALGAVAVDPTNPQRVVVSTVSWGNAAPSKIIMSNDAGKTWNDITGDLPDGAGAASMAFDPTGKYLYISRYAGSVYKLAL